MTIMIWIIQSVIRDHWPAWQPSASLMMPNSDTRSNCFQSTPSNHALVTKIAGNIVRYKNYLWYMSFVYLFPTWLFQENRTSIYLGTDYEVAKVNIDVCTLYKRKDSCIHDGLCFWCNDTNVNACRPRDNSRWVVRRGIMNDHDTLFNNETTVKKHGTTISV